MTGGKKNVGRTTLEGEVHPGVRGASRILSPRMREKKKLEKQEDEKPTRMAALLRAGMSEVERL